MKYLLIIAVLLASCSSEVMVQEKDTDPIVQRDTLERLNFDVFKDKGHTVDSKRTCYYKSESGVTHQLDIPRREKYKNKIYVQTLTKRREDGSTYRTTVIE